jgi:hypothetical protein
MKYIIIFFILLISCNNYKPKENSKVEKVPKEKVIKSISILRESGFFEEYDKLSDSAIYEKLHSLRKIEYSKIFEKEYDPGMELDEFELCILDNKKVLYIDLEADVCSENNVYVDVIKKYSTLTNNIFNPQNITETWDSESGPIKVTFELDNKKEEFNPKYNDDWLDSIVFEICNKEIRKKNIRLVDCLGDSKYGFGQDIAIMRLTKEEQKILEKNFKWKFRE